MGKDIRDLSRPELEMLYRQVLLAAAKLTPSPDHARELTQQAFALAYSTRPWDPQRQPSLYAHLVGSVRSLLSNERTSKRRATEKQAAAEWSLVPPEATQSAEVIHLDRARVENRRKAAAAQLDRLRAELVGHTLDLSMLDAMLEGVMAPVELAQRLRRPVDEIYDAFVRIRRRARRLAQDAPADDEVP